MAKTKQKPVVRRAGQMKNPGGQLLVSNVNRPKFESLNGTDLRITNTEAIYVPPSGAGRTNVPLNPAANFQFGWLSNIARNFNKYRFEKLDISYVSRVATTRDGSVSIGMFYDYESSQSWFVNNANIADAQRTLSYCSEFAYGPVYAGGNLGNMDSDTLAVSARCGPGARRMNWFTIDPDPASTTSEQISRYNICVQNFLGVALDIPFAGTIGTFYATYTIVLSECAPPYIDLTFQRVDVAGRPPEWRPFPSYPPIDDNPPKPKPPPSGDKPRLEEDE